MEISGELTAISQDRVKPILFRVRNDIEQVIHVAIYSEIEAPARINTSLPNVPSFIVLLGSERRMSEVLRQQRQLFVALLLNAERSIRIAPAEALRVEKLHQEALIFFVR